MSDESADGLPVPGRDAPEWRTSSLVTLLRRRAAERPDAGALADAPNRGDWCAGPVRDLNWAELVALVDRTAAALAGAGVGAGDRVGVQLPNVSELVVIELAVWARGAVAVPFPVQHRRHEIETGWRTAGLTTFVTAERPDRPEHLETIAAVADAEGGRVLTLDGAGPGTDALDIPVEVTDAPSATGEVDDPSPDDPATICWTSGTTGTPKGVPRTHRMWTAAGYFNVAGVGLGADDVVLCPFPLVNMAGIGGMLVPWLLTGYRLVLHQPFDLATFLGQIESERVTYTVAPPVLLSQLLRAPALLERVDLASLRVIGSGSAPLDPDMVAGWEETHGIEVVNIYGSNEGAALLSSRRLVADPRRRARDFPAIGRDDGSWPTPIDSLNRTRLVDPGSGREVDEPGGVGELRLSGPTVFDGYLDSDGEEFDEAGYFRTGDLFALVVDEEGRRYYRFVDRAKDIIIRGGMNISAAELEGLLASHPAVREVAVVGAPGGDMGEQVAAVVVADDPPPTLEDLVGHLRAAGVASYKLPQRVLVVDELPRNPLGKVVKSDLRRLVAEG
ncbi:MAG: (2,3-dihydroxybenzoyl)adenylate synthase [Actinomyces sp.]|nr:MAG: (2,3-dihydroxybenzoyl)adenylate synthase [Actinomyces sp.]